MRRSLRKVILSVAAFTISLTVSFSASGAITDRVKIVQNSKKLTDISANYQNKTNTSRPEERKKPSKLAQWGNWGNWGNWNNWSNFNKLPQWSNGWSNFLNY